MKTIDGNYFIGTITEILDPDLYIVKVDIPGITIGATAYPMRGEIDEPQEGNIVLVRCLDSIYQSYYMFSKLKENSVIGFRSRGKVVNITEEKITVGIFSADTKYKDEEIPNITSWIEISKDGNIDIKGEGTFTLNIDKNAEINVLGSTTLTSKDVTITGGSLTISGTASATGEGGFCAIPVCPFTGAPHIGHIISGT